MPENKKRPKALKIYLANLDIAAIKDELIMDLHLINKIQNTRRIHILLSYYQKNL